MYGNSSLRRWKLLRIESSAHFGYVHGRRSMVASRVECERRAAESAPNWHQRAYDSSLRPPMWPPMSCDQKKQPTLPAVLVKGTSKASVSQFVLASPEKWIGWRWSPKPAHLEKLAPRWLLLVV